MRGTKRATLYYLAHTDRAQSVAHDLQYLHRIRDLKWLNQFPDWATSDEAVKYFEALPTAARALVAELGDLQPEIVLRAPSRRRDAEPYLASIKRRFPNARDLSGSVHRVRDVSAGANPGAVSFAAHIALTNADNLSQCSSALIVDDVYSSGTTASAIAFRLEQLGLPQDAEVSIAVPLRAAP